MPHTIFVGNLPYTVRDEDLRTLFQPCGTLARVMVATDRETRKPKGFAFLDFETLDDAERAVQFGDGHELGGRTLNVEMAKPRRQANGRDARRGRR